MNTSLPIIDIEGVKHRLDGDMELWLELVQMFVDAIPEYLSSVSQSISNENIIETHRALHTLKGAMANIGASRGASVAHELELAAKNNDFTFVKAHYPTLEAAVHEVPQACKEFGYRK